MRDRSSLGTSHWHSTASASLDSSQKSGLLGESILDSESCWLESHRLCKTTKHALDIRIIDMGVVEELRKLFSLLKLSRCDLRGEVLAMAVSKPTRGFGADLKYNPVEVSTTVL